MDEQLEASPMPSEHRRAECAQCGGERNCDVLGQHKESGTVDTVDWAKNWYILRCRGCDYVFCQTINTDSESYSYGEYDGHQTIEYDEYKQYWPALSSRPQPTWLKDISNDIENSQRLEEVLNELYNALDAGLHILSAIALRTSFDVASELLNVKGNNFQEKMKALQAAGHIAEVDRGRLELLVEAGNASAHRGWSPRNKDLQIIADILEYFIEHTFITPIKRRKLDEKATAIKNKVPTREKIAKALKPTDPAPADPAAK
ncbi:DUF4145 domain-containing protein [Methylobacterium sp. 092160098-2]|uniref:DUF4145 domain-containing protein n=1 Tax=Methylobacterium sp. 092160098-2 TaxID=3025129 RepID=UPI002381BEC4|nr:DUF4145 domain-containing protein [Methylobacterium sp. 092160098-2]MDE4910350.1 DUF4145 domain-containing protein [Methylobacterium sp. 092160098-2]